MNRETVTGWLNFIVAVMRAGWWAYQVIVLIDHLPH